MLYNALQVTLELVRRDANVNCTKARQNTALHKVARQGWPNVVKQLMSLLATIQYRNVFGLIAVENALMTDKSKVVAYLLSVLRRYKLTKKGCIWVAHWCFLNATLPAVKFCCWVEGENCIVVAEDNRQWAGVLNDCRYIIWHGWL